MQLACGLFAGGIEVHSRWSGSLESHLFPVQDVMESINDEEIMRMGKGMG